MKILSFLNTSQARPTNLLKKDSLCLATKTKNPQSLCFAPPISPSPPFSSKKHLIYHRSVLTRHCHGPEASEGSQENSRPLSSLARAAALGEEKPLLTRPQHTAVTTRRGTSHESRTILSLALSILSLGKIRSESGGRHARFAELKSNGQLHCKTVWKQIKIQLISPDSHTTHLAASTTWQTTA